MVKYLWLNTYNSFNIFGFKKLKLFLFISIKKMPRKSCETLWSELVYMIAILYPNVKTKKGILDLELELSNNPKLECDVSILPSYFENLRGRSERLVNQYLDKIDFSWEIEKVYFTGKTFNKCQEIMKLNTNPETKELYNVKLTKSDIYVKIVSGEIIGISIKSSNKDTKTNYSIEKLFANLNIDTDFKNLRINMLREEFGVEYKYSKSKRRRANKLFYDKTNPYFMEIIETIETHHDEFTLELLKYLYPITIPYDCYEFNGKEMINLKDNIDLDNFRIERNTDYESATSAKLWYSMYQEEKEIYKFEIRGKNDLYKGSMQVLLYNVK